MEGIKKVIFFTNNIVLYTLKLHQINTKKSISNESETLINTTELTETLQTSAVELISSIHGNQRRVERSIEKRDLQSAVKNGKRELQRRRIKGEMVIRYKFTFADYVYITDETCTKEITSWVLPLPLNLVRSSDNDQHQYKSAKIRIAQDPKIITSHSVFVIVIVIMLIFSSVFFPN